MQPMGIRGGVGRMETTQSQTWANLSITGSGGGSASSSLPLLSALQTLAGRPKPGFFVLPTADPLCDLVHMLPVPGPRALWTAMGRRHETLLSILPASRASEAALPQPWNPPPLSHPPPPLPQRLPRGHGNPEGQDSCFPAIKL